MAQHNPNSERNRFAFGLPPQGIPAGMRGTKEQYDAKVRADERRRQDIIREQTARARQRRYGMLQRAIVDKKFAPNIKLEPKKKTTPIEAATGKARQPMPGLPRYRGSDGPSRGRF